MINKMPEGLHLSHCESLQNEFRWVFQVAAKFPIEFVLRLHGKNQIYDLSEQIVS